MRKGLNKNDQSLAWYASSALLLSGEEDSGSIGGSFPSRLNCLPPSVHQSVVNEDPLGEVPHWAVIPEVDLGVVGLWLCRRQICAAADRDWRCCFGDNVNG